MFPYDTVITVLYSHGIINADFYLLKMISFICPMIYAEGQLTWACKLIKYGLHYIQYNYFATSQVLTELQAVYQYNKKSRSIKNIIL